MKHEFILETGGVLCLISKEGYKKYLESKDFNYDYPEGILPLINEGSLIALTTESTEEVKVIFTSEGMNNYEGFNEIGDQKLFIHPNDELFILDHGSFTQIGDWHKGDIDKFEFHTEKQFIPDLKLGWYLISLFAKEVPQEDEDDADYDENKEYFDFEIMINVAWLKEDPVFIFPQENVYAI